MVAHVDETLADIEPHPDAAWRVSVRAGRDPDAEHVRRAAYRNGMSFDVLKPRQHRRGRIDRWIPDPVAEPQTADVVGVSMAQHHRVHVADRVKIRQAAGLRPLAAIEQQPSSLHLDHERRRLLWPEA